MYFIGIDVGKSGAVAVINKTTKKVYDCPLIKNKTKKVIDINSLYLILSSFSANSTVLVENVHAFPGQGVVSMFSFGKGFGIYLGLLTALEMKYKLVTPQKWKKEFNLKGKNKKDSIAVAKKLFPNIKITKSKDGRADALLIAEYGRRLYLNP
ncbi:MAG: hypothetical protein H8E13_13180 [Actinobacteria bacterium]|nr:hypothetical protein [Actinomycetota bacterium]